MLMHTMELMAENATGMTLMMIEEFQLNKCKAGLNRAHLLVGHQTGTYGVVRTVCKAGRLKEVPVVNQQGIHDDFNTYVCILQECIKMKDLAEGKRVHRCIIQSGFKPNTFLLNALVNMYAKCGSMVDARQVFDKMPERDTFSWNMIIAGYAKHGCGEEAFKIFKQMQREAVTPNRVTFICILKACASLGSLEKGKEVHADIVKAGVSQDINMETTLVDMFAKCGSVKDARQVFDNMGERNVVSWSAMIGGYAQHGCGWEALEIYEQMIQKGVLPDKVTFICVLNACTSLGSLENGKEVHAHIIEAGIGTDIILETALADMYAKCGSLKVARQVFDNMSKRNVVSWNAMIAGYTQHGCGREALEIYEQMIQEGMRPNRVTFLSVLNACASLGALEKGQDVHADISKCGITPDLTLENTLVDMYAKCGSIKGARQVFDNMAQQDVVSWSAMIAGYAQHGCGTEALDMYAQMRRARVMPTKVTFICALNACASLGDLEKGMEVQAHIVRDGIAPDIVLENTLVDMFAKCGSVKDAREVFDNMAQRDVVSWSTMIAGYAQHGCGREAFEMYEQMVREGVTPNKVTFICVLNACASLPALGKGKQVHTDIIKAGIESYINLENSLVNMYAKCGSLKDAHEIFANMARRDVVSWNAMIAGFAQHGCGREAIQIFEQMQQEGLKPDDITYMGVLSACSHVGLVDEGRYFFDSMSQDHGLTPTMEHFGCMVDLLSRGGQLEEVNNFINQMPIEPDALVWATLLGACRIHGDMELAEHAAKCLLKCDPQHALRDGLLSNTYAVAGGG